MRIRVTTTELENLKLEPIDEATEIGQNVTALAVTPKGTVPLDRNMGLSMKYIDRPMRIAASMFEAELITAVDDYESRVQVTDVTTEMEEITGRMVPVVEVERSGKSRK